MNTIQPTTPNKSQNLDNNHHIFQIPRDCKQENEAASHPLHKTEEASPLKRFHWRPKKASFRNASIFTRPKCPIKSCSFKIWVPTWYIILF